MARIQLSFFKVLELPEEPQGDAIYFVLDTENDVALWYVTDSLGVAYPASDPAALIAMIEAAIEAIPEPEEPAWTVVENSDSIVTPTAADSGKYYRLTHPSPEFQLPYVDVVAGKTHFFITFAGSSGPGGDVATVDDEATIDYQLNDGGSMSFMAANVVGNLANFTLYEVRFLGSQKWASNLIAFT